MDLFIHNSFMLLKILGCILCFGGPLILLIAFYNKKNIGPFDYYCLPGISFALLFALEVSIITAVANVSI